MLDITTQQKQMFAKTMADWNEKLNVGCLLVGMFQPDHILGGFVGSIVCLFVTLAIRMRFIQ